MNKTYDQLLSEYADKLSDALINRDDDDIDTFDNLMMMNDDDVFHEFIIKQMSKS